MPGPEPRLHLPHRRWPVADRLLWERAMDSDDPFAEAPGARLAKASRQTWAGFERLWVLPREAVLR
jgi:hypothetical protein